MSTGKQHHRWKGGKRVHSKGYIEITAGPYRWWKEHRMVMDLCLKEWNPWAPGVGLREIEAETGIRFHVHHMDFDKRNNPPGNLLLIDNRIHDSHGRYRGENGQFISVATRHEILEDGEEI